MKVVILAGGMGSRILEKTETIPKPMIEVAGRPMIYHIMKSYNDFGYNHFIVALGYLQEVIKSYFLNFSELNQDISVNLRQMKTSFYEKPLPNWQIDLIDTGLKTQTGGRLKRLKKHLGNSTFMMTYGDGLSDVNITKLLKFHKAHSKLATVTAVHPPSRFGGLTLNGERVETFSEKPQKGWINGGFFILEPEVLDYIDSDETMWEKVPLENLATAGELMAFKHEGFWHPMDTMRDHRALEELCQGGKLPWRAKEDELSKMRGLL